MTQLLENPNLLQKLYHPGNNSNSTGQIPTALLVTTKVFKDKVPTVLKYIDQANNHATYQAEIITFQ